MKTTKTTHKRKPWWYRYGWPIIHPIRFRRIWKLVRQFRRDREQQEGLWQGHYRLQIYGEIGLAMRQREPIRWPISTS